jgi:hypothetical protein
VDHGPRILMHAALDASIRGQWCLPGPSGRLGG